MSDTYLIIINVIIVKITIHIILILNLIGKLNLKIIKPIENTIDFKK